jgi:hypothetical protein
MMTLIVQSGSKQLPPGGVVAGDASVLSTDGVSVAA